MRRGLALCFEQDDSRPPFATPGRAAALGSAPVRQLSSTGSAPALARRGAAPAVAMLYRAVGDDVAWKPLNFGIPMHTRDGRPAVRAAAMGTLGLCFRVVGGEFLVMLPEALGFLSELLEDPHGGLERAAWVLLKDVVKMRGGARGLHVRDERVKEEEEEKEEGDAAAASPVPSSTCNRAKRVARSDNQAENAHASRFEIVQNSQRLASGQAGQS